MTRILVLLMAALALVAAGCGGTSKDDYEQEVKEVGNTLERQFNEIGQDIQSSGGLKNASGDIAKGADALDDAAADLEDIEPPDDAKAAHDKIVSGIEDLAGDFREAADAASQNNTSTVLKLFNDIARSEGARKISEAREELKKNGYDVDE